MSLRADLLKTNPNKVKAIMKEVTSILGRIDDEIKTAYDQDKTSVLCSVPIVFAIPYTNNINAQRAVYYKILESLLERNYTVEILMNPDSTIFHIKWLSPDEEKEVELRNALLAKHTIRVSKK
jgi:hypothetical protein